MFGFEITSDLLIVAIFAQTIAIALIVLTIYFKIKKIQYKNIDLNEKIDEKLDRVESKLSYLYNQVLVISANQDKFNYPKSSLNPSTYYRTRVPTNEESDSQSLLKDTTLYGQNSMGSRIADNKTNCNSYAKESETEPIPVIETSSFSHPKSEPAITTTSSSSSSSFLLIIIHFQKYRQATNLVMLHPRTQQQTLCRTVRDPQTPKALLIMISPLKKIQTQK